MPDVRYRGWLYATGSSQRWLAVVAKSCGSFSPIPIFHLMIAARKLPEVPGDRNGKCHACAPRHCQAPNALSGYERGYEAVPSLGARQRGIAHRFPSTRLRGMDSQHANAGRGVSTLFECDAARLIESGNWQLACDGRGEVLHGGTPLSQPLRQLAGDIRLCPRLPSPRGCATTTRRPSSRRRPRIGAGWDPVTKSINNQTASCACLRRTTSSLRVMRTSVTRLVICCSRTLPNQACAPERSR